MIHSCNLLSQNVFRDPCHVLPIDIRSIKESLWLVAGRSSRVRTAELALRFLSG